MKPVDIGTLVLRLAMGLSLFFGHGLGKVLHYSERAGRFPDPLGIGSEASLVLMIIAEVLCALAVAAGMFTRLATIPPIIGMSVAILFVHRGDPFGDWEKALLFLAGFLAIALIGPGRLSLDTKIRGRS